MEYTFIKTTGTIQKKKFVKRGELPFYLKLDVSIRSIDGGYYAGGDVVSGEIFAEGDRCEANFYVAGFNGFVTDVHLIIPSPAPAAEGK